jgi:hypothetical protein
MVTRLVFNRSEVAAGQWLLSLFGLSALSLKNY